MELELDELEDDELELDEKELELELERLDEELELEMHCSALAFHPQDSEELDELDEDEGIYPFPLNDCT